MARIYNKNTLAILTKIAEKNHISGKVLYPQVKDRISYKDFYNTIFRLSEQELITKEDDVGELLLKITPDGQKLLVRSNPKKDGVWKLVIFDIPEKQKYVRTVLRAKLKALHFKKWQNSIWISPYALDTEIETELKELGKKFFIRLIKSTEINITEDLNKMFEK
jgi:DNA-binding transcriptional regulator PaaX